MDQLNIYEDRMQRRYRPFIIALAHLKIGRITFKIHRLKTEKTQKPYFLIVITTVKKKIKVIRFS